MSILHNISELELISGDASDRRFYRLPKNYDNYSAICMQFPNWNENCDANNWLSMHQALSEIDILVPKILLVDRAKLCIWLEDLGDNFLNFACNKSTLDIDNLECKDTIHHYKQAILLLVKAQYSELSPLAPARQHFFDFTKLYYEMNFFLEHFVQNMLELEIKENFLAELQLLCRILASADQVVCHRDYHLRNLLVKDEKVYWIDFQDSRMGPHSYDLVSLIRDSYFDMTWKTRQYFYDFYWHELNSRRKFLGLTAIDFADFQQELLLMGLQRNIKALGSFAYLAKQKFKCNYLQYIIPTLKTCCSPQAQSYGIINIANFLPQTFSLLQALLNGKYSEKLNLTIARYQVAKVTNAQ